MVEEIAFENRISNCQGLVTLTLDRVILHTIVHHSSTSTYMPNFIEIKKLTVDGQTDVRKDGRTFETGFIRSTQKNRPNQTFMHFKQLQLHTLCGIVPLQ